MSNQFFQPGQTGGDGAYSFDMPTEQYGSDLNFQNFPSQGQQQSFEPNDRMYADNPWLNPSAPGGVGKPDGPAEFEDEPPLLEVSQKSEAPSPPSAAAAAANIKYTWYQTDKQVVVDALIKNTKPDNSVVTIERNRLEVHVNFETTQHTLLIQLKHEIDPQKSSYKFLSTKIEIKLAKIIDERWNDLEKKEDEKILDKPIQPFKKDWDKVVKTVDEDKGDEEKLNALFQKIYSEGSDEVRKAMNKSFVESGGTVLNTNWSEVGGSKVDIKPPDGMEFKKWDE